MRVMLDGFFALPEGQQEVVLLTIQQIRKYRGMQPATQPAARTRSREKKGGGSIQLSASSITHGGRTWIPAGEQSDGTLAVDVLRGPKE